MCVLLPHKHDLPERALPQHLHDFKRIEPDRVLAAVVRDVRVAPVNVDGVAGARAFSLRAGRRWRWG